MYATSIQQTQQTCFFERPNSLSKWNAHALDGTTAEKEVICGNKSETRKKNITCVIKKKDAMQTLPLFR